MGFEQCDRMAQRAFFSLTDHDESATVIFLDTPSPKQGEFKNKPKTGFVFPVWVDGEIKCWEVGVMLYKQLRDGWEGYYNQPVLITRNGRKGSTETTYDLQPQKPTAATKKVVKAVDQDQIDIVVMSCIGADPTTGEVVR